MIGSATFEDAMENVVRGFEIAGVVVLVVGSVLAFARFVAELFRRPPLEPTRASGRVSAERSCSGSRS